MTYSDNDPHPDVQPGMEVVCSDSYVHGHVISTSGPYLQTTDPDGRAHHLPLSAVSHVDSQVHLNMTHQELINAL
ncbi:DUF2171 domain-containing protein [Deinococcus deserti]|uniref:DUF2171 domain-containing protein n=1 Tax=Deinococcus deserti (strain DSM 17065 / CIP 109153 / LMG 22923 / VCD115) TaxID=546414 RepID=C1D310_DEIDV|nr:DUF2171 domain-containing protein [Deinococcus deserti]ACO47799.1 hypothetical protein Deide_2p01310 [Deinococcus deserti VCD115]